MVRRRTASAPTAGVAGLILDAGRALLVKRRGQPNRGRWSLPGGGVRRDESVREAVVREMREEVGLRVKPVELVDVVDVLVPPSRRPDYHYVVAVFRVDVAGGRPRAGSDAAELRWVSRDELDELDVTENTRAILDRVLP